MIDLRNDVNGEENPENENQIKYSILFKKSLTLIPNKKVKGIKY